MMRKRLSWSLLAIDLAGGVIVSSCVAASFWLIVARAERTSAEIEKASNAIERARDELDRLRIERDRETGKIRERKAALARSGKLPEQAPVESYFSLLSRLAGDNNLRVVRHLPLASREYPGLLERRYAYDVSGSLPDIAKFFRAVEATEYWADIAYLRVDARSGAAGPETNERLAGLTFSVFSSPPSEPARTTIVPKRSGELRERGGT